MKTNNSNRDLHAESGAAASIKSPFAAANSRVLLVDDHPTFREGLKSLINHVGSLSVCGEADGERSALDSLEALSPDMMIVDLHLANDNGLKLIHKARQLYPKLRILVASMYEESQYGERAINAGANGYVCKQDDPDKLIKAIELVCRGEMFISRKLAHRLLENKGFAPGEGERQPEDILSERELQIFSLMGNGYSTKEIAARLNVSPKTVDSHREHLKRKIGISDYTRLVHRAVEWVLSQ